MNQKNTRDTLESKDLMDHNQRIQFLSKLTFGSPIAEEEREKLSSFFIETDSWRSISSDEIDLILGDKGSGKSAFFLMLQDKRFDLFIEKKIFMLTGENLRGDTVFRDVATNPPKSPSELEIIWRAYFLAMTGRFFSRMATKPAKVRNFIDSLNKSGIDVGSSSSLSEVLRSVRIFAERVLKGEFTFSYDPRTDSPIFGYKIGDTQKKEITLDIAFERLFLKADEILQGMGFTIWILLDRLDVAFEDNMKLETDALRALIKSYLNCLNLKNIKIKIFLRNDIFLRITEDGFRELSHVIRKLEIRWDKQSILNLIINRVVANLDICNSYNAVAKNVKANFSQQTWLMEQILPKRIQGVRKSESVFEWIYKNLSDGRGNVSPREFVHFFTELLRNERKEAQIGRRTTGASLFSENVFKDSLKATSVQKLTTALYAEYPNEKRYIEILTGKKCEYSLSALARVWGIDDLRTEGTVRKLIRIGFFVNKIDIKSGHISVAYIYRSALDLKRGKLN